MNLGELYRELLASSYDSYLEFLKITQSLQDLQSNGNRSNGIVMINEDRLRDFVDKVAKAENNFGGVLGRQVKQGLPLANELSAQDVDRLYQKSKAMNESIDDTGTNSDAPDGGDFEDALSGIQNDVVDPKVQEDALNDLSGVPDDVLSDTGDTIDVSEDDTDFNVNADEDDNKANKGVSDDSSQSEAPLVIDTDASDDPSGMKQSNAEIEDNSKDFDAEKDLADKELNDSSKENQAKTSELVKQGLNDKEKLLASDDENSLGSTGKAAGLDSLDTSSKADAEKSKADQLSDALSNGVDDLDKDDSQEDQGSTDKLDDSVDSTADDVEDDNGSFDADADDLDDSDDNDFPLDDDPDDDDEAMSLDDLTDDDDE